MKSVKLIKALLLIGFIGLSVELTGDTMNVENLTPASVTGDRPPAGEDTFKPGARNPLAVPGSVEPTSAPVSLPSKALLFSVSAGALWIAARRNRTASSNR